MNTLSSFKKIRMEGKMKTNNERGAGRKRLSSDKKRVRVTITLPPELAKIADSQTVEKALLFLNIDQGVSNESLDK
jgi:hypothetical protein